MSDLPASQALYDGIRTLILSVRQTVARGVDLLQVHTNYEIGRRIVEQEQQGAERAQFGKEILRELAARLTAEFGKGFSRSNLEYMRRFLSGISRSQLPHHPPDSVWEISCFCIPFSFSNFPDAVWEILRAQRERTIPDAVATPRRLFHIVDGSGDFCRHQPGVSLRSSGSGLIG
jgi:hypothetical protein